MDKNEVVEKVAKCLALSEDSGATEGEREQASRTAERLMLKYNIEQLDFTLNVEDEKTDAKKQDVSMFGEGEWEMYLAQGIARVFHCEIVIFQITNKIVFFGMKNDLEITIDLFERLLFLIDSKGSLAYPKSYKAKIRAYCSGMQSRVVSRLKDLYKRAEDKMTSDCKELIIVKKDIVKNKVKEVFPNTGLIKGKERPNAEAFQRGLRDGNNVSLHSNRKRVGV